MITEDDKLRIDPRKLFPEAVKRVKILEDLKRSWPSIVGIENARYSWPCVLGIDGLTVEAVNDQTRNNLAKMKGTILRGLSSLGYEAGENFTVKINERESKKKLPAKKPVKKVKVIESEKKVRQYMSDAPDTLPEDINYALSHLRMYLEGRKTG